MTFLLDLGRDNKYIFLALIKFFQKNQDILKRNNLGVEVFTDN